MMHIISWYVKKDFAISYFLNGFDKLYFCYLQRKYQDLATLGSSQYTGLTLGDSYCRTN